MPGEGFGRTYHKLLIVYFGKAGGAGGWGAEEMLNIYFSTDEASPWESSYALTTQKTLIKTGKSSLTQSVIVMVHV